MFKIVLIILALIGLVGTTTHYAFANNMGGPAMGPADSGGGGGGSSSQGPSDTTTSPGGGGGAVPDTTLSSTAAAGFRGTASAVGEWSHHTGTGTEEWQQHPDWTVADWHRQHHMWGLSSLVLHHHHYWKSLFPFRFAQSRYEAETALDDLIRSHNVGDNKGDPFEHFGIGSTSNPP